MKAPKLKVNQLPVIILPLYNAIKDPDGRKLFLDSFSYLNEMCESLEIPINSIDFNSLLGENGNFLSRREINKILIAIVEKAPVDQTGKIVLEKKNILGITPAIISRFNKETAERGPAANIKRNIDQMINNIRSYTRQIEGWGRNLFEERARYKTLVNAGGCFEKMIEEFDIIIKSGEFSDFYFDSGTGYFHAVTAKDCVLEHNSIKMNFGKFNCTYDINSSSLHFTPYKDNISWDRRMIHPHIFDHGGMCYGTATAAIAGFLEEMKLSKIFSIANMILHSYNEESPVTPIDLFVNESIPMTTELLVRHFTDYVMHQTCHKNIKPTLFPKLKLNNEEIFDLKNIKTEEVTPAKIAV